MTKCVCYDGGDVWAGDCCMLEVTIEVMTEVTIEVMTEVMTKVKTGGD